MKPVLIITFLMLIFTGNLSADLNIRYDSIINNQKRPLSSILIKRDLVRINQSPISQPSFLVNLRSGDIVQLHPQSQRFFKINTQTLGQYVSIYQNNKSMFQGVIDHGLQQLPPQKRTQIRQLINEYNQGSRSINNLSIKPTNKSDQVLGVDCSVLGIFIKNQLQREICIADYQQLGLNAGDIKSLELLKNFIKNFKKSITLEQQELLTTLTNGISHLNGIPLKVVNYYSNGQIQSIIQTGAISFRSIPMQVYRIPNNFQQQSFPVF